MATPLKTSDRGCRPSVRPAKRRRGAAIAEFVIVAPLLWLVLMSIMEFGTLYRDYLILHQGARDGARQAAIGKPLATVRSRIRLASFNGVTDGYITVDWYDSATASWSPVGNIPDGSANNAPSGSLVRARIHRYPHAMITGRFFSWLPEYANDALPMSAQTIMGRE